MAAVSALPQICLQKYRIFFTKSTLQAKFVDGQNANFIYFASGQRKFKGPSYFISEFPKQTCKCSSLSRRLKVVPCAYSVEENSDTVWQEGQEGQEASEKYLAKPLYFNKQLMFHQTKKIGGKSGFVSFYGGGLNIKSEKPSVHISQEHQQSSIWHVGPLILIASTVLPPFFLKRFFESYFQDSLLTDFLILFFTEVFFYTGVAIFLIIIHYAQKTFLKQAEHSHVITTSLPGYKVVSRTTLLFSVVLPLVSLGLVWPWIGPAACAAVAPYLLGLTVQFAFEQYVRYKKSPVWPIVPAVFKLYRLHQLNRATQLVAGLMFSLRGAEMTQQTFSINASLQTLLNILQALGIICLWSLAVFTVKFLPSSIEVAQ